MATGATSTRRDVVSTGFLMHLLGFDRFTSSKAVNGLARAAVANPFNVGIVGNCRDFWTQGSELGVKYDQVYKIPWRGCTRPRGGASARRTRMRQSAGDNLARPNMPA